MMPASSLPHPLLPLRIEVSGTLSGEFVAADFGEKILLKGDDGFLYEPASWLPDAAVPACAVVERWLMTRPEKTPAAWSVADAFMDGCSIGPDCHRCGLRHGDLVANAVGNQPSPSM